MTESETSIVDTLLSQEVSFKRLYDKHHYLKAQVQKANNGLLVIDDTSLEKMKKEKLLLKDQMAQRISEFTGNQAMA